MSSGRMIIKVLWWIIKVLKCLGGVTPTMFQKSSKCSNVNTYFLIINSYTILNGCVHRCILVEQ